jgi:hypothetical protein
MYLCDKDLYLWNLRHYSLEKYLKEVKWMVDMTTFEDPPFILGAVSFLSHTGSCKPA